jgi:hypothetical protein
MWRAPVVGLRATVDAYRAHEHPASRLYVFDGLGVGTTMLSTRAFENPDATPLEELIAEWCATQLLPPEAHRG